MYQNHVIPPAATPADTGKAALLFAVVSSQVRLTCTLESEIQTPMTTKGRDYLLQG